MMIVKKCPTCGYEHNVNAKFEFVKQGEYCSLKFKAETDKELVTLRDTFPDAGGVPGKTLGWHWDASGMGLLVEWALAGHVPPETLAEESALAQKSRADLEEEAVMLGVKVRPNTKNGAVIEQIVAARKAKLVTV